MHSLELIQIVYLILLAINFISYYYSSLKIFKKSSQPKNFQWYVLRLMTLTLWYGAFIEALFFGNFNENNLIVAAMLMCVTSLCLFWISARHIHGNNFQAIFDYQKPHLHLHTGPYKYIRHPFYTAYILCYLSLIVSLPSKLLTLIIFLIAGYYYWAAKKEESSFLESSFSDSYKNYIKNTGMFFPKFFN